MRINVRLYPETIPEHAAIRDWIESLPRDRRGIRYAPEVIGALLEAAVQAGYLPEPLSASTPDEPAPARPEPAPPPRPDWIRSAPGPDARTPERKDRESGGPGQRFRQFSRKLDFG